MPNPYDKDKLGAQAIVNFSSIKKKSLDSVSEESLNIEPKDVNKEQLKVKVTTAQMHADNEIEKYRELVENFCKEVNELTLFENVGDAVQGICVSYILEMVIEPILKGNKPYGMPDDLFRKMRKDLYKNLIDRYVD